MNGAGDNALGLYISIPFCRSKCAYCNFASGVYPDSQQGRHVARVIADLAGAGAWTGSLGARLPRRVDTVYLGGGTPSLLAPDLMLQLFQAMRAEFDLDPGAEITVECAPGQLPDAMLEALMAAGVNRVSLGVQSFIDREARASGRLHTRSVVENDLHRLRAAGIANLNVDLIVGLAGQTFASWTESLAALVGSGVPHASLYMLEVDQHSRLGRELLSGGSRYHAKLVPTGDAVAEMYEQAVERLRAAGLKQYEISNFGRSGFESRHNLRYWQRRPYLGVGLDASSMLAAHGAASPFHEANRSGPAYVLRATTTDDMKAYLDGAELTETEWLSPAQQHEEAWFLGLRLNAGVRVPELEREFGRAMVAPALKAVERLAEDGLVAFDEETARLTARGRLLSNDVFQEFLGLGAAGSETCCSVLH